MKPRVARARSGGSLWKIDPQDCGWKTAIG
jgi:hypothetical protein